MRKSMKSWKKHRKTQYHPHPLYKAVDMLGPLKRQWPWHPNHFPKTDTPGLLTVPEETSGEPIDDIPRPVSRT